MPDSPSKCAFKLSSACLKSRRSNLSRVSVSSPSDGSDGALKQRLQQLTSDVWTKWQRRMKSRDEELQEVEEEDVPPKDPPLLRFRRVARLVQLCCGVCLALRRYAAAAGYMENYMVNVTRRKRFSEDNGDQTQTGDDEMLDFDPKEFRIRHDPTVPHPVKMICQKRPEERTPEDIKFIAMCMRSMPSFRKYTKEMQELLCKIVRHERCEKRRVVLRKGHIGYNLYLLYSGAVNVVLSKDENSIFTKQEVITLTKGACFGEIALVQNTRRNATIVCAEDCEFFVVDKDAFVENGLDVRMREEFDLRYKFFRKWSLLNEASDDTIQKLSLQSRLIEFVNNKVIVKDSRDNEWMYFVIKGSCDVLRIVDMESCPEYRKMFRSPGSSRLGYHTRTPEPSPRKSTSRGNTYITSSRQLTSDSDSDGEKSPTETIPETPRRGTGLVNGKHKSAVTVNGTEKEDVLSDIGPGVFVKIDILRDGGCYGLDALIGKPPFTSLVSQGCEVIQISHAKFRDIVDESILKNCPAFLKPYPKDTDLFKRFLVKSRWDSYKHEVLAEALCEQKRSKDFENSLRDLKKMRYRSYDEISQASLYADPDTGPEPISLSISLHDLTFKMRCENKRQAAISCPPSPLRYNNRDTRSPSDRRPKTCPPTQGRTPNSRKTRINLIPVLDRKWTGRSEDSLSQSHELQATPVLAKGSQRTLQVVQGVRSSAHARRMRTIQTR